jgi:acetyltransferase-like isoleucine patch superfamily enzyme
MSSTIAGTAILMPSVRLGDRSLVQDYVVLGESGVAQAPLLLEIGSDAIIRSHTVIYHGNRIGDHFRTGHGVMIREGNEIGADVSIGSHSIVEHHVVLRDRVRIHSNAFIPEFSTLEEDAWIGPSVTMTNALYPKSPGAKTELRGPHVLQGAKVGANATLLPGVTIGRDALVGAGSVVIQDVPDGAVVVGSPARIVRMVADIPAYRGSTARGES